MLCSWFWSGTDEMMLIVRPSSHALVLVRLLLCYCIFLSAQELYYCTYIYGLIPCFPHYGITPTIGAKSQNQPFLQHTLQYCLLTICDTNYYTLSPVNCASCIRHANIRIYMCILYVFRLMFYPESTLPSI